MTKDVFVSVTGLQVMGECQGAQHPIEMVTVGEYHFKNGKHFIRFDEAFEGFSESTVNLIKVDDNSMEVRKKGTANVHMVFTPQKKNITFYQTPFGAIQMGISATRIKCEESEENIDIQVDYSLELNEETVADCYIALNVRPRSAQEFSLVS